MHISLIHKSICSWAKKHHWSGNNPGYFINSKILNAGKEESPVGKLCFEFGCYWWGTRKREPEKEKAPNSGEREVQEVTVNSVQRCQVGLKLQTQQDHLEAKHVRLVSGFRAYLDRRWWGKWRHWMEPLKRSHLQGRLSSLYECRLGLQGEWLENPGI